MTAIPPEWEGRFRCPACPLGFHTLQDKKHHIRAEHPRPKKPKR